MVRCPKCGYERTSKDNIIPPTECPKCGVIYAKVKQLSPEELAERNKKNQEIKEREARARRREAERSNIIREKQERSAKLIEERRQQYESVENYKKELAKIETKVDASWVSLLRNFVTASFIVNGIIGLILIFLFLDKQNWIGVLVIVGLSANILFWGTLCRVFCTIAENLFFINYNTKTLIKAVIQGHKDDFKFS